MAKKIEHEAASEDHRMTLEELAAFVSDAYANGGTGAEEISANVTMRGKLRNIRTHVSGVGPDAGSTDRRREGSQ